LQPFRDGPPRPRRCARCPIFSAARNGCLATGSGAIATPARARPLAALDSLADAFERHDLDHRRHEDVTSAIRRDRGPTFTPRRGTTGAPADAVAARFGDFDHASRRARRTDWPSVTPQHLLHRLLKELGWRNRSIRRSSSAPLPTC
jgi:hypothetical protein